VRNGAGKATSPAATVANENCQAKFSVLWKRIPGETIIAVPLKLDTSVFE
jgi:hypothetical protein